MKKLLLLTIIFLLLFSCCLSGCGKKEAETGITPDTEVSENEMIPEQTVPTEDSVSTDEITYPYWWELYDYNLDQEVLNPDGEIKNLTLQLGSKTDELYITWFSKSDCSWVNPAGIQDPE